MKRPSYRSEMDERFYQSSGYFASFSVAAKLVVELAYLAVQDSVNLVFTLHDLGQ